MSDDVTWEANRFLREHDHYVEDLQFWADAAEHCGAPILDLGAAAGRVALSLAEQGHEVWGLDSSQPMLDAMTVAAAAADLSARVHPVLGDMAHFDLGRTFPLIIIAMNTLQVLTDPADQLACLTCVRSHLAPHGEFAFDVVMPDFGEIQDSIGLVRQVGVNVDATTGTTLVHWATYENFDPVSQTATLVTMIDETDRTGLLSRTTRRVDLHVFMPSELGHLLARAGLAVIEAYGDFDGEPLHPGSQRQVYRCQASE